MALTKKGQARLEQIGEKAMYLFNEKGYVNTSMDAIFPVKNISFIMSLKP